jgi:hypothetical protein
MEDQVLGAVFGRPYTMEKKENILEIGLASVLWIRVTGNSWRVFENRT